MHLFFESIEKPGSYTDCNLLNLSWMGRVPDSLLQSWDNEENQHEDNWKLNRVKYYEEGWLATGNQRGIIGVTYTSCKCPTKSSKNQILFRTNYNLKGHRAEVIIVKWNEPYQKLATVDLNGTIFVWVKYEGRWSIELINDRYTQVVDFNWSHDGRMALISYVDGFFLIGSVAGQRYWSSLLNLESNTMTSGVWSPDDKQIVIGVSNGSIMIINLNGSILAHYIIKENVPICKLSWCCEKFKMDDENDVNQVNQEIFNSRTDVQENSQINSLDKEDEQLNQCFKMGKSSQALAICFEDGFIYLMKSYDDLFPIKISTQLLCIKMEWSNKGEILAVAGHRLSFALAKNQLKKLPNYINVIQFYAIDSGQPCYVVNLEHTLNPITAITWGHNDKRLFVATGNVLHVAWVTKKLASLQLLCRLAIHKLLKKEKNVKCLQLPAPMCLLIRSLFNRTIRCYLPNLSNLRNFIVHPPPNNLRFYCTLIRHVPKVKEAGNNHLFSTYILYLEYLGGLIPILKGKRISKLKPEFVIFDPQDEQHLETNSDLSFKVNNNYLIESNRCESKTNVQTYWYSSSNGNSSESEAEDNYCSNLNSNLINSFETLPSSNQSFIRRNFYKKKKNFIHLKKRFNSQNNNENIASTNETENNSSGFNGTNFNSSSNTASLSSLNYIDEMPEKEKLILISSNIWGTHFKVLGLTPWLPSVLGSISYRTSLLHLQPRQMRLLVKEMVIDKENNYSNLENSNMQKSESNLDYRLISNLDNDFGWSNSSFEEDDCLNEMIFPVAPIQPQYTNQVSLDNNHLIKINSSPTSSNSSNFSKIKVSSTDKLNTICSLDEYLTLQINNDQEISCNLDYLNQEKLNDFNQENFNSHYHYHYHFHYHHHHHYSNFLQCNPSTTLTNSVSTQTSFPSLNQINFTTNEYNLNNKNENDNTMSTLASCSRLLNSTSYTSAPNFSSSIYLNENGQIRREVGLNKKRLFDARYSLDFMLQRRLFLKKRMPKQSSCYSLKIDKQKKIIRNCMYLDDEEEEELDCLNQNQDLDLNMQDLNNKIKIESKNKNNFNSKFDQETINQSDLSNESLNDLLDFDDQSSKLSNSSLDLSIENLKQSNLNLNKNYDNLNKLSKSKLKNLMSTPIHKKKNRLLRSLEQLNIFNSSSSLNNLQLKDCSLNSCILENDLNEIQSSNQVKLSNLDLKSINSCSDLNATKQSKSTFKINYLNLLNKSTKFNFINRSLPATPLFNKKIKNETNQKRSFRQTLLYSPMMIRKAMKQKLSYLDCSSEDDNLSDDEMIYSFSKDKKRNIKDKNNFGKFNFQLNRKHTLSKIQPNNSNLCKNFANQNMRELLMYNKAPVWNESTQVYQLDFGGRVTQESAKNFQIEHDDKQVLQFGRIDANAYTLDFQQPFSALQAISVALANVTQRLK